MNINLYTIDNKMIDFSLVPSPCYVMDEFLLRKNLELMHSIQERAGVKIILALKGFALWGAFRKIKEYLPGATASSLHEAMLCWEEMGVKPHTYCVAYREEDFDTIASLSSHITFNSISQYNTFKNRLKTLSSKVSCGLRINPECSDVKYDIYNPSSPQSRLGITIETFPDTIPDGIEGLHFHTLCESNSYSLERVMESVEKKFSCFLKNIRWINMGGGHLMTDSNYHVEHLIDILQKFRNKWGIEIILEPGGAVAWETGFLVVKILDIVENGGVKTAILDTSFSCHMSDFFRYGQQTKDKKCFHRTHTSWYPIQDGRGYVFSR